MTTAHDREKVVFITGATGFVGSYMARRMYHEGYNVVALERTPGKGDALRAEGITVVRGDLRNIESLRQHFETYNIHSVMHIGAWLAGGKKNSHLVNTVATEALARIALAHSIEHFVFTSSIAVYGLHGDTDVDETTPISPYADPYGDSKIKAERILMALHDEAGLPVTIIRPGMIYGPNSRAWAVRLAQWAAAGLLPMPPHNKGTAYPVYIDNLIDLMMLTTKRPEAIGQVYNAVDNGPITMNEFFAGYMAMTGSSRALRLPCWAFQLGATAMNPFVRDRNYCYVTNQLCGSGWISNQKAKDALGWQPAVGLTEGLRRTEDWLRDEGYLSA